MGKGAGSRYGHGVVSGVPHMCHEDHVGRRLHRHLPAAAAGGGEGGRSSEAVCGSLWAVSWMLLMQFGDAQGRVVAGFGISCVEKQINDA